MPFVRTPQGLSALPLFQSSVSVHVFVEGDPGSSDPMFWKRVFSTFWPEVSLKIKRAGPKAAVLSIANEPRFDQQHIVLCVDRDHDDVRTNILHTERVVKTRGYSIENDALTCVESIVDLLEILTNELIEERDARQIFNDCIQDVSSSVHRASTVTRLAINNDLEIEGEEIHSCLAFNNSLATFDEGLFFDLISRKLEFYTAPIIGRDCVVCDPVLGFRGHTLFNLISSRLKFVLNAMGHVVNIDQRWFLNSLIQKTDFRCELFEGHYSDQLETAATQLAAV